MPADAMPLAGVGLIVDWGGVLTTPVEESFADFLRDERIDPSSFAAVMRSMHDEPGSPLHQVEVGAIDRGAFETALAEQLRDADGVAVAATGLLERMFRSAARNEAMRAVVAAARASGWRTAVLSNAWGMDYDEDDLATFADALLLSDRIGVRKPSAEAYALAAAALDLPPSECIFVDDLRRNVVGATAVGMTGFHYRPGSEADLRDLLDTFATIRTAATP